MATILKMVDLVILIYYQMIVKLIWPALTAKINIDHRIRQSKMEIEPCFVD